MSSSPRYPHRAGHYMNEPFARLVSSLLRSMRAALKQQGVIYTDAETEPIAEKILNQTLQTGQPELFERLKTGLQTLLETNESALARLGLTFEQSLKTEMNGLKGWESTSDFLEIANIKISAETRIAFTSNLLILMGDRSRRHYTWYLAKLAWQNPSADIENIFALRALSHISGISLETPDVLAQLKTWLYQR